MTQWEPSYSLEQLWVYVSLKAAVSFFVPHVSTFLPYSFSLSYSEEENFEVRNSKFFFPNDVSAQAMSILEFVGSHCVIELDDGTSAMQLSGLLTTNGGRYIVTEGVHNLDPTVVVNILLLLLLLLRRFSTSVGG